MNNREEQIEKASVEYQLSKRPMAIGGDVFADEVYRMNINPSFIAGAEWADEHPNEQMIAKYLFEKKGYPIDLNGNLPPFEDINEEKVDNANKVVIKPKFKPGDWITFYGDKPFKILKIEEEQNGILDYFLLDQNGYDSYYNKKYVDENARLWAIQDAKDGDVLANDNSIFIFQEEYIEEKPIAYCGLMNGLFIEGENTRWSNKKYKPATKEQRDILFQKMKEAGYGWDAEKKELKKIEQKQDPCEHCNDICLNCHNFPCINKRAFEQNKSVWEIINEEKVDNENKVIKF